MEKKDIKSVAVIGAGNLGLVASVAALCTSTKQSIGIIAQAEEHKKLTLDLDLSYKNYINPYDLNYCDYKIMTTKQMSKSPDKLRKARKKRRKAARVARRNNR